MRVFLAILATFFFVANIASNCSLFSDVLNVSRFVLFKKFPLFFNPLSQIESFYTNSKMCNSNVDTKASPVMSPATAPVKAEKADKKVSKKRKRDAELATLPTDSPKKTKTKKSKKEKKEKDTDAQPSKKAKTNSGDAVVPAEKEEKVEEAKAEENGVLTREQYYEKHDIKFWDGDVERPYQSFADIESYINKYGFFCERKQYVQGRHNTPQKMGNIPHCQNFTQSPHFFYTSHL